MRKLRNVAVLIAAIGSIGLVGGTAHAGGHGDGFTVKQHSSCKSHDLNVDVLGQVGALNGLGGNLLGGEGNPGAQVTGIGSDQGCSNSAF
ncbi:hypothetical protein [Streptomyces sp. NPDC127066]|uniref:hypothetical protein n=1 Tax=Streptomyces sp. NPDC127066 TaxID=3347125 RepID=UPI0036619B03